MINEKYLQHLAVRLSSIPNMPSDAINWLLSLHAAVQFLDDVTDQDKKICIKEAKTMTYTLLSGMPSNKFYLSNAWYLSPLIESATLRWCIADQMERDNKANAITYAWTYAFFEIVLGVLTLVFGSMWVVQNGSMILSWYGDKYEDYIEQQGEEKCQQ